MMKIGNHVIRATVVLVGLFSWSPNFVHAVPNLEILKDYLDSPKAPIDWNQKRFAFLGFSAEWLNDAQWLAREAGLEFAVIGEPKIQPGSAQPAQHPVPLRSLMEIFDIGLQDPMLRFALVRGQGKLYLLSADAPEEYWPEVPRLPIAELSRRSRTDLVEIVANLEENGQDGDLVAGQMKKLLGEFGAVTPIGDGHYILRGLAGALMIAFDHLSIG